MRQRPRRPRARLLVRVCSFARSTLARALLLCLCALARAPILPSHAAIRALLSISGGATGRARSVVVAATINGGEASPSNFKVVDTPLPRGFGLADGSIIFKAMALSADPYMRGALRSDRPGGKAVGEPLVGFMAGKVTASKNADYPVGCLVGLRAPLCTAQVLTADDLATQPVWKLDGVLDEASISRGVGVLGMPGATAYGGLLDVLQPVEGQTLLVTAASGAVGALVGQIAKNKFGCRVIGTTGGVEKAAYIVETLGFDAAIDYQAVGSDRASLAAAIAEAAGESGKVDMVFESVGGAFFEAAFDCLAPGGRIAVAGGISLYGGAAAVTPPVSIDPLKMIYSAQRIEGFVSTPWLTGAKGNFLADMHEWLQAGWLKPEETVFDGIETYGEAFQSLFNGAHRGKVVIRVPV